MGEATYAIGNFAGGEISQFAQGRFDKPDYRISLKVCLNAFPNEIGTWLRRPGTQFASTTRRGATGRVIKFDFEQANAVTLEFTDGFLRFRNGTVLIDANDSVGVIGASTANPCVIQTNAPTNWVTGNAVYFSNGNFTPLVENRIFAITVIDSTHFSLGDEISGASIDGSTLGPILGGPTVFRIQELTTSYVGGSWAAVRSVQAETTAILLEAGVAPQALTVMTLPSDGINPVFALNPAIFNDGPYLDPFTNGLQAVPSAVSGVINLTLQFATYSSTTAYPAGAFVTSSSVNYVSLVDQNEGNTPVSSPSDWATTSVAAAVNGGRGFLGTDIGRSVRLQDSAGDWTWGRITGLSNIINRALSGSASIGNMVNANGINAVFDGAFTKSALASAELNSGGGVIGKGGSITLFPYVGKNYSGASAQKIQQVTIYPADDQGLAAGTYVLNRPGFPVAQFTPLIIVNLRGKATLPASSSDGTLLGTSGVINNQLAPVTIVSNDQATTWNYVWVEMSVKFTFDQDTSVTYAISTSIAQLSFFGPTGTGTGTGITMEILGPVLADTTAVNNWRLGAYSNTTGWPTCGCYDEGRLWLSGAIANRFDASVSNGIVGGTVNFAPTGPTGTVADSNAISETLNSDGVNPIFWMQPDLQGILCGTQAGEYLIVAPTTGPISPSNIAARRVTSIGSSNIEPRRTEHTLTFVKRYGRKLMEYFPDVFSGKFSAPNLADKAEHIVRTGIAEIAYTEAVTPVIWGRNTDGSWFGITYKRDSLASAQPPTYYGWHRQALGSGRTVESICAGPSVGGNLDALTMVTNSTSVGRQFPRHVEILTDTPDELTPLADSWFLDDAVNPTSTSSSITPVAGAPYGGLTINGLWYLNGSTVQVFAGGMDCGDPGEGKPFADFLVTNGSIFVPYGDSISAGSGRGLFTAAFAAALPLTQIVVGFTYNSDGQMVKPILPADSGARNGPAFGKLTRAHRYSMKLVSTLGLSVGGSFTMLRSANLRKNPAQILPPLTAFTGIAQDSLQDDYFHDGGFCWRVSRPFPANVAAIGLNLQTMDQ